MTAVEMLDLSTMDPVMTIAFIAFGIFIIFQSSEYWQRVYAARNSRVVKRGFIGAAILTVLTGFVITLIGLSAHLNLPNIEAKDAFAFEMKVGETLLNHFLTTGEKLAIADAVEAVQLHGS